MIVMVDSKNLAYRMNWAFQSLKTRNGFPTSVLFGFWKEIFRIHKLIPEASFVFCWDGQGKSWRHRMYNGYKQGRYDSPMAGEARVHVMESEEILRPLFQHLGFWTPRIDGVEADDLIGILAKALGKKNQVRIYSSDKDMFQLVDRNITAWTGWDQKPLTEIGVEKVWGVPPKHVTEIRAMAGDSSDNLKGLPGIGPKKALKLWAAGIRPSSLELPVEWGNAPLLFKDHWPRVHKEFQMATIITDPQSTRWSEDQRSKLTLLVDLICQCQGRRRPREEKQIEKSWYDFLAQFELNEIFVERHLLWKIS
jgi:5'-3' exonuclease-like protein